MEVEGVVLKDWRRAVLVLLYEDKGDNKNYKNHKEISLLSVVGKRKSDSKEEMYLGFISLQTS